MNMSNNYDLLCLFFTMLTIVSSVVNFDHFILKNMFERT